MYVYVIRAGTKGAIKIGVAMNIERRIATLQTGNAFKLNLIALIPCDNRKKAQALEARIHRFFERQRIRGEWFQGNINFKKIENIQEYGSEIGPRVKDQSAYKPMRDAKKKRRAEKLKRQREDS